MEISDTGPEAHELTTKCLLPRMPRHVQDPVAIVGLACRLPGNNNTIPELWDFLARGDCADTTPPSSRFNLTGHYNGSQSSEFMASPGGMFLENIDPRDIDAQFFKLSRVEAISMDPQQRQLLEVVYEGLENVGIGLETIRSQPYGCFVGSYASDYNDIQSRDPGDRAQSTTVGVGRAMLSNRISHFLDIKGPSMTIDTACSGSLIGVDIACHYLHTKEISGAIVAGCNLYLNPEHTMDHIAVSGTASATGRCHTFDAKADGYVKSEAVNMLVLKRLDDAIRDGDPIRAIIRGSATNNDGWTAGIASPSSNAQAEAIRQAYSNAQISDFSATSYVECHGTGTRAGDPIELSAVASVFSATRPMDQPLLVGSIKSNIGHSEPAAGLSGVLKVILALEKGIIPGNPTFETPNPQIDFEKLKVRASKISLLWPDAPFRRASVNSFGYGGSNAHIIMDHAAGFLKSSEIRHVSSYSTNLVETLLDEKRERRCTLVFSADDRQSLRSYCKAMARHLINPIVNIRLRDLAYTLSERRTQHFHRAYIVAQDCHLDQSSFVFGEASPTPPRIGFVFTGQGSQWSTMGKDFVATFPAARSLLRHLDEVLQRLPDPPCWSLIEKLTEPQTLQDFQLPIISQPVTTALQLVILNVLRSWGIQCQSVVGHSSGEIAAAVAGGYITPDLAIQLAYYRGKAVSDLFNPSKPAMGMLAVGLSVDEVKQYVSLGGSVEIGCINSPSSVTLSGELTKLQKIQEAVNHKSLFARLLPIDVAYHSSFVADITTHYHNLLTQNCAFTYSSKTGVTMFSSVTGEPITHVLDANYWKTNMLSPVLFSQALTSMVSEPTRPDLLIEIGPSKSLAAPISHIKQSLSNQGATFDYVSAYKRGPDAANAMFELAGRLSILGGPINLRKVNEDADPLPASVITDLPNYYWNHSTNYWHESDASKDWRFRTFVPHYLLGSKILGTAWNQPAWKKILKVRDLPWLEDHKLGSDIVFPAAGYISMAVEALFQKLFSIGQLKEQTERHQISYRLRNVAFMRAMVLEERDVEYKIMLHLTQNSGLDATWHEFTISSTKDGYLTDHCRGLVSLNHNTTEEGSDTDMQPFEHSTPAHLWYKAMRDVGYSFGPEFQKQIEIESLSGTRTNRALVSFSEPKSKVLQRNYPIHPCCIDGCFQSGAPSLWYGQRSSVDAVLVPAMIDEITLNSYSSRPKFGIAVASARYTGAGRPKNPKSYKSDVSVYDTKTRKMIINISGLRYNNLDIRDVLHACHSYTRLSWKPDISFTSPHQLQSLSDSEDGTKILQHLSPSVARTTMVIDMIAHKSPRLRVIEVNAIDTLGSLWLDEPEYMSSARAACRQYHLALAAANTLPNAQTRYGSLGNVELSLVDFSKTHPSFGTNEAVFDLCIMKISSSFDTILTDLVKLTCRSVSETGHILLLNYGTSHLETDLDAASKLLPRMINCLTPGRFQVPIQLFHTEFANNEIQSAYVISPASQKISLTPSDREIHLVHFSDPSDVSDRVIQKLNGLGWQIKNHTLPITGLQPKSLVLVLDELYVSTLLNISEKQWRCFQYLIEQNCKILWVTKGSQFEVTLPNNALVHGLARTLRAEDVRLSVITLDVESDSSPGSCNAIHQMLEHIKSSIQLVPQESEFAERRGVIHVSRVLPDYPINQAENGNLYGTKPRVQSLHDHASCVRLVSKHTGSLDSLQYEVIDIKETPLQEGFVEVDIHAASLNFKDVAVALGLVPADEYRLGIEGGGIVRRVGPNTKSFEVGQRVLVMRKGSFANRVQSPVEGVHLLPQSMSFEDAATLPCVYLVSIYGLIDLTHTQRGQSVLIHSAAGGVGIAAIQLCQYLGARIYATVGNEEKRQFLIKTFAIPTEHIFTSRSTAFASALKRATSGKGVDVILNSLSGDLLDESWRCIADGGTFIEIGKKDMLERKSLSMEPFCRNASYRAIDISHESIPLSTIARLLSQMFHLIGEGHIKPIFPRKEFSFGDISNAFRYMRSGNHIGKILITDGLKRNVQVPIHPAIPTLRLREDASYLIVGGLKGLCGSLAVYLARHGARHLIVMSRSSYTDNKSKTNLSNLKSLGAQVDLVTGDVASLQDVQQMFRISKKPIAGIIQGAMVLRDKIFTSMNVEDFHEALRSKVYGTWNLHKSALEQNLSLDFFTMLSSISGVVGQKSQANYAAANVFLDSFSAYRNRLGLPACSIDLGVIEDVGYISEREALVKRLDSSVWTGINEGLLHKILCFSIFQQTAPINPESVQQMITGIPVPQIEGSYLLQDARFTGLCSNSSQSCGLENEDISGDTRALLVMLKANPDSSTVLTAAIGLVNGHFMKSLGLSEPIEAAKALSGYGIDSLAAVDFRNWVRTELGADITSLEILNAKSLSSLCQTLISRILSA